MNTINRRRKLKPRHTKKKVSFRHKKSYKHKRMPKKKRIALTPEPSPSPVPVIDSPEDIKDTYLTLLKIKEEKIKELENEVKSPIKKMNCSPTQKQNDFTCYGDEELHKIKDMWNKRNPNDIIIATDKKKIWIALMKRMKNVCDNEMCWLKQQFVDNDISTKIIKDNFAPQSPQKWKQNPNEWLSNFDLKDVMKQYEKKIQGFFFYRSVSY